MADRRIMALPLVDPELLRFFSAGHPGAGRALQQEMTIYTKLLEFGWSVDDLVTAAKTGYNYQAHTIQRQNPRYWNWKYGRNSEGLTNWLCHYYQQMKAEEIGLSFEDFVRQWCTFFDHFVFGERRRSLEIMQDYMRARRRGLSHHEADWMARYYYRHRYTYLDLRRKGFTQEQARALIETHTVASENHRPKYGPLSVKYIIEAHRRGAAWDDILASVRQGTSGDLALGLRQAAHER